MTHAVEQDWRTAQRSLAETKAAAVQETLDHLADLETLFEQEGVVYEAVCQDIRNLSARLRSIQRDYEHDSVVGRDHA